MIRTVTCALVLLLAAAPVVPAQQPEDKARLHEFFEKKVRPVLAEHCFRCHGAKKQAGGLRLDSRKAMMAGTDMVPVIRPGNPEQSRLIKALQHTGEIKMPPKAKLPEPVLQDIATWIKLGAPLAEETAIAVKPETGGKDHWAFQSVRKPAVPAIKRGDWPINPVDHFILAKLEAKGIAPNPAADRRTLLRRLKLDLVGLPPTAEEVEAFERSAKPQAAYIELVEKYLGSPQYGERWARHWLDVARYADTKGYVFEEERRYPYAYAYRDYVVKAFNDDLPYDQFVMQQLAADRLVAAGQAPASAQAAMGYLTLGRRFLNNIHDIIDDRIDVVSRGLLGLTVTCARCHDHKFDPIPTADYYSLHGVFASSVEPKDLPLIGEPAQTKEYQEFAKKLKELEQAVTEYRDKNKKELAAKNRKYQNELRTLQKKVDGFKANSPAAPPRAMILKDAPSPAQARILLRGNPNNPGANVPRQFLAVLSTEKRQPFKDGSGRLELARAIASKDNPLTARVIVNRVWLHHFGKGLVTTPSDFGVRSDPPSHPELLDYLAARFVEEGWSIKKLHRLIVTSQTYHLSSADNAAARDADPENRLLARFNRQRLDFEGLRDSLLAVGGNLDAKMGGPAVDITKAPFAPRRTLYGFIDRQNLPGLFRTFDFASPDASTPQRYQTTVPQQALFLLNSPFAQEQARALVRRPEVASAANPSAKVRQLYRIVYAREPDADEVRLALQFIETTAKTEPAPGSRALTEWERFGHVLLLANEFAFAD